MKIKFSEDINHLTANAYMFDYGQQFEIEGLELENNFEMHYSVGTGMAEIRKGKISNNTGIVAIPDFCFENTDGQFEAWLYIENETSGKTIKRITVFLEYREPASEKPQTHDIGEVKQYAETVKENADKVLEAEEATKKANEAADSALSIANTIEDKLNNGEFDGKDSQANIDVLGWRTIVSGGVTGEGLEIIVTDKDGDQHRTKTGNLIGAKGDKGDNYFLTEADKQEIAEIAYNYGLDDLETMIDESGVLV